MKRFWHLVLYQKVSKHMFIILFNGDCIFMAVCKAEAHPALLCIKRPNENVRPQLGLSREERLTVCSIIFLCWGPSAQPYSWGDKAMPEGKLNPRDAPEPQQKKTIDSTSHSHQVKTDPSGFLQWQPFWH